MRNSRPNYTDRLNNKRFECLEKRYLNVTNYYYYYNNASVSSATADRFHASIPH